MQSRPEAYPGGGTNRAIEKIQPMVELAKPTMWDSVLDVASGWGFVALAFAPRVRSVTGIDLTPEMVQLGEKLAKERDVSNVDFKKGGTHSFVISLMASFTFATFGRAPAPS